MWKEEQRTRKKEVLSGHFVRPVTSVTHDSPSRSPKHRWSGGPAAKIEQRSKVILVNGYDPMS